MKYHNTKQAIFLKRPNRFIAYVLIGGKEEVVHVKNTGRCKELLKEGAKVIVEESQNKNRKTKYSLIAVYKGDRLINMDSQVPNAVVYEALEKSKIEEIGKISFIKREVTYSKSRFDIYYEKEGAKGFIEVKGVTLEEDGCAMFPDAPTERGTKHVEELIKAAKEGYETNILFLIQMDGIEEFKTNEITDKKFANAVEKARKNGVCVLVYNSIITEKSIEIGQAVKMC